MKPYHDSNGVTVYHGDSWELASQLEPQSINTVVTSPPYWGLRDYGEPGQFGLESTPDEYVAKLVDLFRRLKPALRDDGTVWLNLGDSYAAARGGTHQPAETLAGGKGGFTDSGERVNRDRHDGYSPSRNAPAIGLKHKDLAGIPWRVAFALQADGWYLRQDIIWHKPNPMPESVTDRCTKSHEYIFLLSKSPRYYFDNVSIKETAAYPNDKRRPLGSKGAWQIDGREQRANGGGEVYEHDTAKRNKRSVWSVSPKPFKGAHFAVFPPDLIEPCVLAGCPEGGTVLDPFFGSGTTAMVAQKHGRKSVGFELNADYIEIALNQRLAQPPLL